MSPRKCGACDICYGNNELTECPECKAPWVPLKNANLGKSWEMGYSIVRDHISKHGTKNFSSLHESFIYWISQQRRAVNRGDISEIKRSDRYQKLKDLGLGFGTSGAKKPAEKKAADDNDESGSGNTSSSDSDEDQSIIDEDSDSEKLDVNRPHRIVPLHKDEGDSIKEDYRLVIPDARGLFNAAMQSELDSLFKEREDELKRGNAQLELNTKIAADNRKREDTEKKAAEEEFNKKKQQQEEKETELKNKGLELDTKLKNNGVKESELSTREILLEAKEKGLTLRIQNVTNRENAVGEREKNVLFTEKAEAHMFLWEDALYKFAESTETLAHNLNQAASHRFKRLKTQ